MSYYAAMLSDPSFRLGRLDFARTESVQASIISKSTYRTLVDLLMNPDVPPDTMAVVQNAHDVANARFQRKIRYYHRLVYDFDERHPDLHQDLRAIGKNCEFIAKHTNFAPYDENLEDWHRSNIAFMVGKVAEGIQCIEIEKTEIDTQEEKVKSVPRRKVEACSNENVILRNMKDHKRKTADAVKNIVSRALASDYPKAKEAFATILPNNVLVCNRIDAFLARDNHNE